MASGGFGNVSVLAKAFFYNANLLCIRPAPTAASIGDRKDLYFRSVSMVGHSAGSMPKSSAQKDGPRRSLTFQTLAERHADLSFAAVLSEARSTDIGATS